jgi:hypothetical protein
MDDLTRELAETLRELRTKFDAREHLSPSMVRVDAVLDRYDDACKTPEPLMKTNPSHPAHDWDWHEEAEVDFVEWFNDLYGQGAFTLRSEWFEGDCEELDLNTRKRIMRSWVHAAFVCGYEHGKASTL